MNNSCIIFFYHRPVSKSTAPPLYHRLIRCCYNFIQTQKCTGSRFISSATMFLHSLLSTISFLNFGPTTPTRPIPQQLCLGSCCFLYIHTHFPPLIMGRATEVVWPAAFLFSFPTPSIVGSIGFSSRSRFSFPTPPPPSAASYGPAIRA